MFVGKYIHMCTCVGAHISNMWVHRCDKTTSGLFLKCSLGVMLRTSKPRRLEHGKWRSYAKFFCSKGPTAIIQDDVRAILRALLSYMEMYCPDFWGLGGY